MKSFKLKKIFQNNSIAKVTLLFIASLLALNNLMAQSKAEMKLAIETGLPLFTESENFGFFLYAEPKLKSSKNTFIGLRIGISVNTQKIENNDSLQFIIDDKSDNGGFSFVPTLDYYFKKRDFKNHFFRPYTGLGLGYYLLSNYIDVSKTIINNPREDKFEVYVNNQVGFLLRTGLESNRWRIGLEYNYISKASIKIPNGQTIGSVNNGYFGLSFGYIFGGKKR